MRKRQVKWGLLPAVKSDGEKALCASLLLAAVVRVESNV